MREQMKISLIIIISVFSIVLLAGYRDYRSELRFKNIVLPEFQEQLGDDSLMDFLVTIHQDDVKASEPNYFKSLFKVITIDTLIFGILVGWLMSTKILKKERDSERNQEISNYQWKNKTFKLSLLWFDALNLLLCIMMILLGFRFSYYAEWSYGINYYIQILIFLVNLFLNIYAILVFKKEDNNFWYMNTFILFQILILKIYTILSVYDISDIDLYDITSNGIIVTSILLFYCITYIRKLITSEQKKTIRTICGFIVCGLILLMFLEVIG
ncbi:hypothetical protein [Vallitalea okinawensis]|uniref:hypothetical protein n=1 Tax=Vallitalea okinawensis TaxID=2078660 RepID=UPI000CFD786C|nr:hypothetical protein [Vallitalea okinawensis]